VHVDKPPVVDGRLDDDAWSAAPSTSAFTQKAPVEGAAPTERTTVRGSASSKREVYLLGHSDRLLAGTLGLSILAARNKHFALPNERATLDGRISVEHGARAHGSSVRPAFGVDPLAGDRVVILKQTACANLGLHLDAVVIRDEAASAYLGLDFHGFWSPARQGRTRSVRMQYPNERTAFRLDPLANDRVVVAAQTACADLGLHLVLS
jgi:hypothetical protein